MTDNHHYEYAPASFTAVNASAASEFNAECREDAMIQSNLAIAYEQRTANLLAAFGLLGNHEEGETLLGERMDGLELAKEIKERLAFK